MPSAAKDFVIDRNSFEPPYKQLGDHLRRGIATGEYRVGRRLPSESELCAAYGVSRMTARRAIGELVTRGLAERRQGRGVYACGVGLSNAVFNFDGLMELLAESSAEVRVLEITPLCADKRIARELETKRGTPVVHIRQLLEQGERPILYRDAWTLSSAAAEDAEHGVAPLAHLLAAEKESLFVGGIIELNVHVLSEVEAEVLKGSPGAPAWRIEHQFYGADRTALSWGHLYIPGDLLRFPAWIGNLISG